MSSIKPEPDVTRLDALRAAYRERVAEPSLLRQAVDGFDRAVASHPKTAVTVAAVAGGFIGARKNPITWVKDGVHTTFGTLAGAVLGGFGLHIYLAHLPAAVASLAATFSVSTGCVEAGLALGLIGLGAEIGHTVAHHGIEKRDRPAPPVQADAMDTLRRKALNYSGLIAGTGIGVAAAALGGVTAALPLAAAGAGGLLAGIVLGPLGSEQGCNARWKWAAALSLTPIAAALGYHMGPGGPIWAGVCGIDAAGATVVGVPFVRRGILQWLRNQYVGRGG